MEANKSNETKYERIRKIGIGSYGVVFKCVNRQTGQIVAIKRYSENDSDPIIRKIAMREVRMLRQLKHPNLIQLIEVFRRRRILHLVFDYCELTVLDVIEKYGNNCPLNLIRKIIWQLVNGVSHCHSHNCIHRDIKPENILINQAGVVKLCDFGFARNLNTTSGSTASRSAASNPMGQREAQLLGVQWQQHQTAAGKPQQAGSDPQQASLTGDNKENRELLNDRRALTEYVATRWYRAPELLVGDIYYDIKIDIWAIGCVTAELMRGEPLWPGKTDLDQLCLIKSSLGQLTPEQSHNLLTRGLYEQVKIDRVLRQTDTPDPLDRKLPNRIGQLGIDFVLTCLQMDPGKRPTSDELLQHQYIRSALMGQFVRGASHGSPQTLAAPERGNGAETISSSNQKAPIGHGMIMSRPAAVDSTTAASLPRSGPMVHRSNSQAILRVANSQQPASKRLVLGPDSSSSDGLRMPNGGGGGGATKGGSLGVAGLVGSDQAAKHGVGSLVSVFPVRSRHSAISGDERNYASRQSRHKRKTPRQLTIGQPPASQTAEPLSRLPVATGKSSRLNIGEQVSSEKINTAAAPKRSPIQPANRGDNTGSSTFGSVPVSSLMTSKFSSSQINLIAASNRRRSSDGGSGGNGGNSLALMQQATSTNSPRSPFLAGQTSNIGGPSSLVAHTAARKERGQRSMKLPAKLQNHHQQQQNGLDNRMRARDQARHESGSNNTIKIGDNSASTNSTMSSTSSNSLPTNSQHSNKSSSSSSFLPPVVRQATGVPPPPSL
uniref:cyclin-dependent kinase n=1 Tax=Aceria tosichella TaxID=561515 RepID=A0A6G1SIN3_9ACAR